MLIRWVFATTIYKYTDTDIVDFPLYFASYTRNLKSIHISPVLTLRIEI